MGAVLGLIISPSDAERAGLDIPGLKTAILGHPPLPQSRANMATWPNDEIAKQELFRWSKWDYANFASQSTVRVNRCISLDGSTIACEMTANLSWVQGRSTIEAVFKQDAKGWSMVDARTRQGSLR